MSGESAPRADGAQLRRGDAVVCVTGDDAATVDAIAEHTGRSVPVLACPTTEALWRAIEDADTADVVLLAPGCRVADGWLAPLAAAARADPGVATASPLLAGVAEAARFAEAAARVQRAAGRTHPRLPAPAIGCAYVTRAALELTSELPDPRAPGRFADACRAVGLWHLLVDEVLVLAPAAPGLAELPEPVARAHGVARRAVGRLSVAIDARAVTGPPDGTRVHVLEMLAALGRSGRAHVTALLPFDADAPTRALVGGLPGVEVATIARGGAPDTRADVVHRPYQLNTPADLPVLAACGERVIVTQQDLIGYHSPAYFPSAGDWESYRALTRVGLTAADHVLFCSEHARLGALAEDLASNERSSVVRHGVDHQVTGRLEPPVAPPGAQGVMSGAGPMLCLGTDFRHKNRVFALRVAAELQSRHGWPGRLVFAGPRIPYGSSRATEAALLEGDPRLAAAVVDLPAVTEAEKRWLLERVSLVIYPTLHEGFGLVPFEAAEHGLPCLWAPGTAMSEVLPDEAAGIVAWDAATTADRAHALMSDDALRAAEVQAVRDAAAVLRWDDAAALLVDTYAAVCDAPPNPLGARERASGLMRDAFSEDATRLVGPGGVHPRDAERPLLALVSHERIARPALALLRAGYRISQRRR